MRAKEERRTEQRQLESILTLKGINLSIKKGQLVFIVGKIASGKSSLLSAIIGDLLPVSNRLINSYGGQEGLQKFLNDKEAEGLQSDMVDD